MIRDRQGLAFLSAMGWVDRGSLWCFDPTREIETRIPLSDANYLSLHAGSNDYFSVVHHFDGNRVEVTAHRFAAPPDVLSRASVGNGSSRLTGDLSVWEFLPRYYVAYYTCPAWSDFALLCIDQHRGTVEVQTFDWYNEDYDKGCQGIVSVTEVPGQDLLIVSIQRDSHPVLYDPIVRRKVGQIGLAGRGGNPRLYFRRTAGELWADDYDTIVRIDPASWRVLASRRLQSAAEGCAQFIGKFAFDSAESVCTVARPFSGDVIGLDPRTLRIWYRCKTGGQPLEVGILGDMRVFARDWKSGALLKGRLRRRWML
ncbi:MAG: hypothetical protein L0Y78_01575 [candidate division NC10 bacterium]|nr:hypothetical protein [candidate division NC10 bacterium]